MKILAIDSSGLVASAAILEDEVLRAEYTVNFKKTHSQTLLPMIDEIVEMLGVDLNEMDAIALAGGPGSFTGLRIGAATAKGLGLALDKPLVAVPTVDAIAYNLVGTGGLICPMMDARRSQVYTGIYRSEAEGDGWVQKTVLEQTTLGVEELAQKLNELGEPVVLLGDGVPVYFEKMKTMLTVPCTKAPAHVAVQRAGAVAALAAVYYREGKYETAAEHQPEYLRLSQAERERAEKEKQA